MTVPIHMGKNKICQNHEAPLLVMLLNQEIKRNWPETLQSSASFTGRCTLERVINQLWQWKYHNLVIFTYEIKPMNIRALGKCEWLTNLQVSWQVCRPREGISSILLLLDRAKPESEIYRATFQNRFDPTLFLAINLSQFSRKTHAKTQE